MRRHDQQQSKAIREWIIFSLSLGFGAHLVLGLRLHAPEAWPMQSLWIDGFLISLSVYLSVYIVCQVIKALWKIVRSRSDS